MKKITKNSKIDISLYFILRFLVIVCMILQILNKNWNNVFLCALTLILFTIPTIVDKKFNIPIEKSFKLV